MRFILKSQAEFDSQRTAICQSADDLARDLECFRRAIKAAGYESIMVEWLEAEECHLYLILPFHSNEEAAKTVWAAAHPEPNTQKKEG